MLETIFSTKRGVYCTYMPISTISLVMLYNIVLYTMLTISEQFMVKINVKKHMFTYEMHNLSMYILHML